MAVDISRLAHQKAEELIGRSELEAWSALACLWVRTFVLIDGGWSRWPELRPIFEEALLTALDVASGGDRSSVRLGSIVAQLESASIEDDGSAEWQHLIDLIAMLLDVLQARAVRTCIENAIAWFLEGEFNIRANELAEAKGTPVSESEARRSVESQAQWAKAVALVGAL